MLQKISDLIGRYRIFLITAHERLDGDALGSELGLYHMLLRMGKEATVYNQDETPENYRFLPGSDRIVHELPPPPNSLMPRSFWTAASWNAPGRRPPGSGRCGSWST